MTAVIQATRADLADASATGLLQFVAAGAARESTRPVTRARLPGA